MPAPATTGTLHDAREVSAEAGPPPAAGTTAANCTDVLSNLMLANLVSNTNLAQQNAVLNQQAGNDVARSVTGKVVNAVLNLGPLEAMSALQLLTGNAVAHAVMDLLAARQ